MAWRRRWSRSACLLRGMVPSSMKEEEVSRRSESSCASLDSGFFLVGRREMVVVVEDEGEREM